MKSMQIALLSFVLLSAAPSQSQTVYFLVTDPRLVHNDCYILPLSNPAHIAHARALIWGPRPSASIVLAHFTRDFTGLNYNRNLMLPGAPAWSWHITELVSFAEWTIEILDGTPTSVEQDFELWGDTIGFWNYTVMAELGTDLEPWFCDLDAQGVIFIPHARKIELSDLSLFCAHWLETGSGHRTWAGGADLNGDSLVDLKDYATFARNWKFSGPSYQPAK